MANYKNIYNSICRLCLSYTNSKKMITLIDKNSEDGLTAYAKAVSTFAHINFTKEDCLPNSMCTKCLYLLKQAIHFKLVTESSDNCFKKIKNSFSSENLKEKVIELAMFNFYFPSEFLEKAPDCFKSKKNTEFDKKTKANQLSRTNSVDDAFSDNLLCESDLEQEVLQHGDKILDKIESRMGLNSLKSQTHRHKRIKMNKKTMCLKEQYNEEIDHHSMQKKNFCCNICNKVLANQSTYDHHMQRHVGCRFMCEHCGKGFPILNELQIHQVMKHGTGPYLQCSHCPFKAPRKFDLIEHERIHTGERPYTCDKCGLTFRRRAIWKKHLIHHSDKKIQCSQCPKKFFLRSEMLAHANNIHDRVYFYSCSKCDATYTKTATVRRHMTERHGIPRELQGKVIRVNKGSSYQEQ